MTIVASMCTKNGIFMISDSLICIQDENGNSSARANKEKSFILKNSKVGISFWGTVDNNRGFNLHDEMPKIKERLEMYNSPEQVAAELTRILQEDYDFGQDDVMGFHVAGYDNKKSIEVWHVFHESFLEKKKFIKENCLYQHHQGMPPGQLGYYSISRFLPYPILFNGDTKLFNLIINGLRTFGDFVPYQDFNNSQSRDFLIFLMDTAINLQSYAMGYVRGHLIKYPLMFLEIIPDGVPQVTFLCSADCISNCHDHKSLDEADLRPGKTNSAQKVT